jgi:hypothetical protein
MRGVNPVSVRINHNFPVYIFASSFGCILLKYTCHICLF